MGDDWLQDVASRYRGRRDDLLRTTIVCCRCGRVGVRGFVASSGGGALICAAPNACRRRSRTPTSNEWGHIQPLPLTFPEGEGRRFAVQIWRDSLPNGMTPRGEPNVKVVKVARLDGHHADYYVIQVVGATRPSPSES